MLIRTHSCGQLRESDIGKSAILGGWVNAYRGHGTGLVFIDLRDREGLTQLVFDREDSNQTALDAADKLRNEDVLLIEGTVRIRKGGPNPKLPTGQVEVVVTRCDVMNKSESLPFSPSDEQNMPGEELRLKHRYLDLRRPKMQAIMRTRHRVTKLARDYFDKNGFLEVETPILYKSTPEGAREFVVPSRHVPGQWYALPQSPQLFKQILMVAGCDRYLQITRCFRDEDPRADRQSEFTQIDLEMAFVGRDQVMAMMEGFLRSIFGEVLGITVPPIQRTPYRECLERFGIDRPDTRYGLEIRDISAIAAKTEFAVFKSALDKAAPLPAYASKKGVVKAIRVPGGAEKLTRKITDGYAEWVKTFGAGGLPVVKVTGQPGALNFETGVAKFLEPVKAELIAALGLQPGDTVLFAADTYSVATKTLGELRQKVGRDMGVVPEWGKAWNFLWMIDPPMFERNKDSGKWVALHHPFTAPRADHVQAFLDALEHDDVALEGVVSAGYDCVLNGSEIGGGSIRIHDPRVQRKVFGLLGLSPEQAEQKFSFLLEALKFGAPPHGGIAFGLDRLIMHLCGTDNIRDVIAFPKTQVGADLMTRAPGPVTPEQLAELHVKSTWVPPDTRA